MIGLVIVSHSKTLAEGIRELAVQMSQHKVAIEVAGGLDDELSPIGTDPFKIKKAIENLQHSDGILILMDIGSAVMNAELALDLVDTSLKNKTVLCEAPLVEGAIAASAKAMTGANMHEVINEAKKGLIGKQSLIAPNEYNQTVSKSSQTATIDYDKIFNIIVPNALGLHARPSVKLVEIINKFEVVAQVSTDSKPFVDADSISQIGTLGAKKGDKLIFRVSGKYANDLEAALRQFAKNNFGDSLITHQKVPKKVQSVVPITNTKLAGIGVSKGIAIGKAKLLKNIVEYVKKETVTDITSEIEKLKNAIHEVLQNLKELKQTTLSQFGKEDAEIFDFHIFMLQDVKNIEKAVHIVTSEKVSAEYAWFHVFSEIEAKYSQLDDSYLRERVSDIVELKSKVIQAIKGNSAKNLHLKEPIILVVDEIGPAQTLSLDTSKVLGIISMYGGETSHATILARSLGIPSITSVGEVIKSIKDNELIAMNGTNGEIFTENNDPLEIAKFHLQKEEQDAVRRIQFLAAKQPAFSEDEVPFHILANVSSPKEAKIAFENGAEGIGLYRTEFLYMNRTEAPSEEEQYQIYREVCSNMKGLPITIRTLDVGGDKQIPYLNIGEETNPFLGVRGIRYCLRNKTVFRTQLRALCRVSADFKIKIMYPMIGVLEELQEANAILKSVQEELETEGILYDKEIEVGIMVEVPSVIFLIPEFASEISFLSIGTNDLTQYLLALDRENSKVSKYFSALHPAVLRAIEKIIELGNKAKLDISLCGELASDPNATALLSKMGLRTYSMSSPSIPNIKAIIRKLRINEQQLTNSYSTLREVLSSFPSNS